MKILLIFFFLFFSFSTFAQDISDFQIEGMRVGDSLLNYMTEKEIINEIKRNRYMYEGLPEKFGEVYLYKEFQNYQYLSFFVKLNDKRYKIYSIRGGNAFIENYNACLKQLNEITEEFSVFFPEANKSNLISGKHAIDTTNRSIYDLMNFDFNSGDTISVWCVNYEESLRKKNNWTEGISVSIDRKEVRDWLGM